MAVEVKEQCKKCFHFQVCASVLKDELYIREVLLGEEHPKCKMYIEIVPCKDCVSGHKQIYGNLYRCNVMGCGGLKPDDFCSYGERREGE